MLVPNSIHGRPFFGGLGRQAVMRFISATVYDLSVQLGEDKADPRQATQPKPSSKPRGKGSMMILKGSRHDFVT